MCDRTEIEFIQKGKEVIRAVYDQPETIRLQVTIDYR